MGYSVEAINSEESSVKKRKALQEQILNMVPPPSIEAIPEGPATGIEALEPKIIGVSDQ